MTSVKVSQLPPDLQEKLGYATARRRRAPTNTAAVWAKREIAKINVPQARELGKQLEQKWRGQVCCQAFGDAFGRPHADFAALGVAC